MGPAEFVARCVAGQDDVRALLKLALDSQRAEPGAWGERELLHCEDGLMIVDLVLPPFATSPIHEHRTWAVIGISAGCEVDEIVHEREGSLEIVARYEIRAGEVVSLDADCIHFIANPSAEIARGIHIYGKNLARVDRRMWDPYTARPQRMDSAIFDRWEQELTAKSAAAGAIVAPLQSIAR